MMVGQELRLPDQMQGYPPPDGVEFGHEFGALSQEGLEQACKKRRLSELPRQEDMEEPLLFTAGESAWLENRHKRKECNSKQKRTI